MQFRGLPHSYLNLPGRLPARRSEHVEREPRAESQDVAPRPIKPEAAVANGLVHRDMAQPDLSEHPETGLSGIKEPVDLLSVFGPLPEFVRRVKPPPKSQGDRNFSRRISTARPCRGFNAEEIAGDTYEALT